MTPTPKGGNFGVKSVKLMYFFKNLLLYSKAQIRQIKYKAIMTKKGSARIVNFFTIGAGGLVLGCGYITHYSEYALSSTLSIYITLIAIVLREFNAALLYHC